MTPARVGRVLAAAVVLSTLVVAHPGVTDDGLGEACSGSFPNRTVCHFWFQGFPLIVAGGPTQGGGSASARVWISADPDGLVPLVECSVTGVRDCSAGLPDETCSFGGVGYCPWYGAARATQLSCHVEGDPRGWFQCSSGGV